MNYFVLLLGPSGVGKSTVIRQLKDSNHDFVYISPFTTRELRDGETDKIHMDLETIISEDAKGSFLVINEIHGFRYATPKASIYEALDNGLTSILDWPVQMLDVMELHFGDRLKKIYIKPSSIESLRDQLGQDGRDPDGQRFKTGLEELENLDILRFDLVVINNTSEQTANQIYQFLIS